MRLCITVSLALFFALPGYAAEPKTFAAPDSTNQIIKLTNSGVAPRILHMTKEDSIVFFFNSSSDSLATIEVDFGDKKTHCASSNMKINKAGVVRSVKPFGPRDFASMCFHDPGTYPLKVFGVAGQPAGVEGSIVVR